LVLKWPVVIFESIIHDIKRGEKKLETLKIAQGFT
jgi:hypothetical protein